MLAEWRRLSLSSKGRTCQGGQESGGCQVGGGWSQREGGQIEMLLYILFPCEMLLWCFLLAKERESVYLYHICVWVSKNGQKNNQQLIYQNGLIWKESWGNNKGRGSESPQNDFFGLIFFRSEVSSISVEDVYIKKDFIWVWLKNFQICALEVQANYWPCGAKEATVEEEWAASFSAKTTLQFPWATVSSRKKWEK